MEFFIPKQLQKSISRSLGLFRKAKNRIIAKFQRTDLAIGNSSRQGKTLSYSQKNKVVRIPIVCYSCCLKNPFNPIALYGVLAVLSAIRLNSVHI